MNIASSGIGCFKGCNNPVIGQCPGYEGSCNAFYCGVHSNEKLCIDCATKKMEDERIEKLLVEYDQIAQEVKKKEPANIFLFIVMAIILGGGLSLGIAFIAGFIIELQAGRNTPEHVVNNIGIVAAIILITMFFILLMRLREAQERKFTQEIDKISIDKPFFTEFYQEWKKEQRANARAKAHELTMAVGGAIESYQWEQTRREVYKAAKKINRS